MVVVTVVLDPRVALPAVTPSRVKVTVPVGEELPVVEGVTVADTCMDAPAAGVVVEGVTDVVVEIFDTVTVTEVEVEPVKLPSPP